MRSGDTITHQGRSGSGLRVGDVVVVRSAEEILATLDENGELDSLPFMPEMLPFCGERMTVYKIAHKLCDTIGRSGLHRMERAVHLTGSRCDGSAHGGCQTGCLLYWKEAWLRRADDDTAVARPPLAGPPKATLPLLDARTRKDAGPDGQPRYSCQATEMPRAAPDLVPLRDMRQYVTDVRTGNARVPEVVGSFLVGVLNRLQKRSKNVLPRRLLIMGGRPWPFLQGKASGRTPRVDLDLQPGELVRVKSRAEIMATLNENMSNRGMGYHEEMDRYCGREYRVLRRVERSIDEATGEMLTMKTPCVVLEEEVICTGAFSGMCPRSYMPFWREVWLERVEAPPTDGQAANGRGVTSFPWSATRRLRIPRRRQTGARPTSLQPARRLD